MLDTWRRSGLRPLGGWWALTSRRVRQANIGSAAGLCSVFLAMLAAWLLGAVSAGAGQITAVLLALGVPCLAVGTWLLLGAWPQRATAIPESDGANSAEIARGRLLRAVNNVPIGLVMFDAGKRVLIVNDSYRQIYGLSSEVTQRGSHLREMLEERLASGNQEGIDRE